MTTEQESPNRLDIVTRYVLSGASLGLFIGFIEAPVRYFTPCVPTATGPCSGAPIYFLAPLLNLTTLGLAGLLLGGLAATRWGSRNPHSTLVACALAATAGAHAAWTVHLLPIWIADIDAIKNPYPPLAGFLCSYLLALLLVRQGGPRVVSIVRRVTGVPIRYWAGTLGAAGAVLSLGLLLPMIGTSNFAVTPTAIAATHTGPNIVLISIDTVRADHLSAYGYSRPTTPNLDRLASRGILFENAVAGTSWTLPSFATIFTGKLPHQHGAGIFTGLSNSSRTLAEELTAGGYEAAAFNANGFGFPGRNLEQGFGLYDGGRGTLPYNVATTLVGRALIQPVYLTAVRPDFYFRVSAPVVNHKVLDWFGHRPHRPFFLFINYFDAHDPYFTPPPFDRKFGSLPHHIARELSFPPPGSLPGLRLGAEDRDAAIAAYDNGLAFADAEVGKLLGQLSQSPEWANTVVIVTSDHGEAFGIHGTYLHGRNLYYQEGLHVPLIIAGPGIPAGIRIPHIVRLREIFTTVLDLTVGASQSLQPRTLRRFWSPGFQPSAADEYAISELIPFLPDFRPAMISMITTDWHYLHFSNGHAELYRWRTDTDEQQDLSGRPEHAQIESVLRRRLKTILGSSTRPWRGAEYLYALDGPGYSFLKEANFKRTLGSKSMQAESSTGSRAAPDDSELDPDQAPSAYPDEELLRSLPYR